MPKVDLRGWVTGAAGLIGSHIVAELGKVQGFEAIPITRSRVDLENQWAVEAAYKKDQPDFIIHCAAYSDTAFCESCPTRAQAGNVMVPAHLASLASRHPFIFFSSDLVFDGGQGNYDEGAPVNPLSVYGRQKVAAEQMILANPGHTVVRTSMTGGRSEGGRGGFDQRLMETWQAGQVTMLFTDEFRNPIAASVTARAVGEILAGQMTGLFHLAGAERLSRFAIGELLAKRYPELRPQLKRGSIRDFAGQARPGDCSLSCKKLQGRLSFELPAFSDWLRQQP